MAITKDELEAFHQFAETRLASRGAESIQELVDIWEAEHPTPELHAQNVAAVWAAIRDMEDGDVGRPAETILGEMRVELACRRDKKVVLSFGGNTNIR